MANFTLVPDPTFKAKAAIPVPGKKAQNIEFTFKWRDADEFKKFMEDLGNHENDTDAVLDFVTGWELAEPFGRENVDKLVKNYIGSAAALIKTYIQENAGARLGN